MYDQEAIMRLSFSQGFWLIGAMALSLVLWAAIFTAARSVSDCGVLAYLQLATLAGSAIMLSYGVVTCCSIHRRSPLPDNVVVLRRP